MKNSYKLSTILFLLLFYLLGVFFLRSYYHKKINQQELSTIKLNETLKNNETILTDLYILNQDLENIDCTIDSLVSNDLNTIDKIQINKKYYKLKGKIKKSFNTINEKEEEVVKLIDTIPSINISNKINDSIVLNEISIDDSLTNKKVENTTRIKETQKAKKRPNRKYLFEGINRVYNRKRNNKPLTTKEKFIWIEIQSEHGQFSNSIQNIIKEITINNTHVRLNSVKEIYLGKGKTAYMLGVKIPRKLLLRGKNLIVIKDEQTVHYKWIIVN